MEIESLIFDLHVILGKATFSGFSQLEIGDILVLEQKVSHPLTIEISDKPHFLALPGLNETHKAVKIVAKL